MNNKALDIATQVMVMAIVISVILLFVGIGVLILIHVCIVGRAFRRGFGSSNPDDERGGHEINGTNNINNSISHDDLEKLPSFDFQGGEKGSCSPIDCAVCLENFIMGDKCRLLPLCKHSFHAQCVDSWLLKTPICPICRTSAHFKKGISTEDDGSGHSGDEVGIELRGRSLTVNAATGTY